MLYKVLNLSRCCRLCYSSVSHLVHPSLILFSNFHSFVSCWPVSFYPSINMYYTVTQAFLFGLLVTAPLAAGYAQEAASEELSKRHVVSLSHSVVLDT